MTMRDLKPCKFHQIFRECFCGIFWCHHTSVIPTALDLRGGGFEIVMRAMEKEITKMVMMTWAM